MEEPIKVDYHPAKFVGHSGCDNGDVVALVCHVILRDHTIKASCNFMGGSPSSQGTIWPSLVVIGTLVVEM